MAMMRGTERPECVRLTFHHGGVEHALHVTGTDEIIIDQEYGDTLTITVKAVGMTTAHKRLPLPVERGTVIEGDSIGRRDRFILLPLATQTGASGWRSFETGALVNENHIENWKIIMKGTENG